MNWYFVIKFLHIIATIMFVGGIFGRKLVRANAKKVDNIHIFAALSRAAGRIERLMLIPGAQAVLVLGVILAVITGSPMLGFLQGASRNWLLVANVLLLMNLLIVPFVFIPRGKKFEVLLQSALSSGQITLALRAAMNDKVIKLAHLFEEVSLVAIVALMVFKPF